MGLSLMGAGEHRLSSAKCSVFFLGSPRGRMVQISVGQSSELFSQRFASRVAVTMRARVRCSGSILSGDVLGQSSR